MKFLNFFLAFILMIYIFGCVEKTTYSGKILKEEDLLNIKVINKKDLINKFGQPSYIDNIQNKYFYYTEKNKTQNFYNKKIEYSYLFIFELDKNDSIISSESINLLNQNKKIFKNTKTSNQLVERGFIEKIFGGIGPEPLPNSP